LVFFWTKVAYLNTVERLHLWRHSGVLLIKLSTASCYSLDLYELAPQLKAFSKLFLRCKLQLIS